VVGAPRSGTTWLQLLLAQHPGVVTSQETHLFERYLAHFDTVWRGEVTRGAEREIGLRPLLTEGEFHVLCRAFADGILSRIDGGAGPASENPALSGGAGGRVVVEKTPGHVLSAEFIHALFPDAHFVHVVRDPRAVVSSLVRAGRGWGQRWAPRGPATAARVWREHIEAGLAIPGFSDRYHEIRYEALHAEGPKILEGLLTAFGLESDETWCERAFDACSIDRLKAGTGSAIIPWAGREPEGFYGKGELEGWREELSSGQLRTVEYVASELMDRLGYASVTRHARPTLSIRWLNVLERLHGALDWRLRRSAAGL